MFNRNLFQAKYIEHGLRAIDVSAIFGINPATLTRKTSGNSDFTRGEIETFCEALDLSLDEMNAIFFAQVGK